MYHDFGSMTFEIDHTRPEHHGPCPTSFVFTYFNKYDDHGWSEMDNQRPIGIAGDLLVIRMEYIASVKI